MADNSLTVLDKIDGFILNKGEETVQQNFDSYYTHVDMSYECTRCQLLEPEDTSDNNLGGILICYDWKEGENDTN